MKTRIIKSRYDLWGYDGKNQFTKTISRDDVLSINKQSFDHCLLVDFGYWGFRTADGRWIEYDLSQKSLGNTLLQILDVVRCDPGYYFSPEDMEELTKIHSLGTPNNLSARWRALRLAHKETFSAPHFFLSKRTGGMGVAWNSEKSFIQITKIKQDNGKIVVPNA